eukprot:g4307.t1
MSGRRSASSKRPRGKDSHRRQRNRTAAVVLATIVALTFLLMLRAPAATSSPPSSTPPPPPPPPPPKRATTPLTALRGNIDSISSERSSPDLGVKDGWREGGLAKESRLDGATTAGGEGAGGGVSRGSVHQEGQGGKLQDGRDRCFVDPEGFKRCYPTAFFFGTSKCGTTSLARWLDKHPSTRWVSNPRRPNIVEETGVKEAHVFDDQPKGFRKAEQRSLHDKLQITSPKASAHEVVIDYTPHYMVVAETPHRIADMYGGRGSGLKFIVTLREPASRAISSWEFKNEINPKKGRQEETRSLAKTVMDGRQRAGKLHACLALAKVSTKKPRERDLKLCNPRKFLENPLYVSHVGKSMYAMQLERWFDLFGRENFKVIFTDDMAADPVGVLKDVLDFLGLDMTSDDKSKGLPDLKQWNKITGMDYNKTKSKKKDELGDQVTDDVKNELRTFFKPHNEALEELLGMPLPDAWKSQGQV